MRVSQAVDHNIRRLNCKVGRAFVNFIHPTSGQTASGNTVIGDFSLVCIGSIQVDNA